MIRQLRALGIVALSRDTMPRPAPGRRRRHQAELPHPTSACPKPTKNILNRIEKGLEENHHSNPYLWFMMGKWVYSSFGQSTSSPISQHLSRVMFPSSS